MQPPKKKSEMSIMELLGSHGVVFPGEPTKAPQIHTVLKGRTVHCSEIQGKARYQDRQRTLKYVSVRRSSHMVWPAGEEDPARIYLHVVNSRNYHSVLMDMPVEAAVEMAAAILELASEAGVHPKERTHD